MKFYIPSKPTKWGFKLHVLAEAKSGYCLQVLLDPGKEFNHLIDNKDNSKNNNDILSYIRKNSLKIAE